MNRRIDELFTQVFESMTASNSPGFAVTPTVDPREYDGYRAEMVNGELTEYVKGDDGWEKVSEDDRPFQTYETPDGDSDITLTTDLSTDIGDGYAVTSATFNNGILEVEFSSEVGESSDE